MTSERIPGVALRTLAANPLAGFRHEALVVAEWEDARVIVRAPSPGDRLFHVRAIWEAAGVTQGDEELAVKQKLDAPATDYTRASAALLVRTLFEQGAEGAQRVFADADVDQVAAAFGPVHARLVAKSIELGNLTDEGADIAKKPSRKRQTSVS